MQGVTVSYAGVPAVAGVDLRVPDGTVLALLGPSGCGKSTLLRAIAGLEPVAQGVISWDGADLDGVPVHHRRFGLMFQDGVLFPHRDVAGNIGYGLRRAGVTRAETSTRVDELLDLVGLSGYRRRRVATLSGGEAQRVALARALAPRPRLLLLDEPLAALDTSLRERLLADLRTVLRSTGTSAVFVTHDQSEAFAIADDLAVMREGTVRQVGVPREIWSRPADEWVARFVGYTTVLDTRAAAVLGAFHLQAARGDRLALRPAALVVDPSGPILGVAVAVADAPNGVKITVSLDGVGTVQAVGATGVAIGAGESVRLRLDPAGTAVLSDPAAVALAPAPAHAR